MKVLKKASSIVTILMVCFFCSFLAGKDFLLAQELKEGKVLEAQELKEGKVLEAQELKEGKVIKKDAIIKSDSIFAPKKRIQLKAEKAIPKAKEPVLKEVKPDGIEVIESKPIPKAEEPIPEMKAIELKPMRLEPIKEIKQVEFETTGYSGEQIIFSSRSIFKLIILEEELYSVGDYLTSQGILRYDGQTKLNYIDIVKIDSEQVSANSYMKLFFKKELSTAPLGSYCEITGIVRELTSQDTIFLGAVLDVREISIDKDRIIESCSSSVRENLDIIISAPQENEGLRNWMSEEYGISTLSENQLLETLNNTKRTQIDYDFFDKIAKCTFRGDAIDTSKDFGIELRLECLYNSNSDMGEKIIISFVKIAKARLLPE